MRQPYLFLSSTWPNVPLKIGHPRKVIITLLSIISYTVQICMARRTFSMAKLSLSSCRQRPCSKNPVRMQNGWCISSPLLCNITPKCSSLKHQWTFIISHSFCRSGIWDQFSKVVLAKRLSYGCSQDGGQGYRHLKAWSELEDLHLRCSFIWLLARHLLCSSQGGPFEKATLERAIQKSKAEATISSRT